MLLWNDLDHNGYFFHDLWFVDMDNLLQVRRQTRSCEIKRTTSTISSTTCGPDSFVTSQNIPINTAIPSCVPCTEGGYLKDCAVLGSAP